MKKTFTANGRLFSQIFLSYNTTLVSEDDPSPYPCTEYRIIDNGDGVSSSDFEQEILEIATDVKRDGKGIGRFVTFQIGANVLIETTAYDSQLIARDEKNTYYHKSSKKDIEIYILKWSDIIQGNRQRLSYLGNFLQTRDVNVKEIFKKDYPELDTSNLIITTKKGKKSGNNHVN